MPQSFYDWLILQAPRQDSIGALASYAKKDILFPRHTKKLYILLLRFEGLPVLRTAAKRAHAEWRKHVRREAAIVELGL